jgi:mono/diheme cytochrome c family protein
MDGGITLAHLRLSSSTTMQRLVLHSVLAVASAILILSATACDSGADKKADNKIEKADDKADEVEPAAETGEPAGTTTTTTTGVVEPIEPAGETEGGETGETGAAVPPDGDSGKEPATKDPAPKDPVPKEADPKEPVAKIDAKALFESKCKSCHGADGKGDTTIGKKVEIPSLASTKVSKAEAIKVITNGVPDTKMKGYADKLSKEEIEAVAAYVKKL